MTKRYVVKMVDGSAHPWVGDIEGWSEISGLWLIGDGHSSTLLISERGTILNLAQVVRMEPADG